MTAYKHSPRLKAILFDIDGTLYSDLTQFKKNILFYLLYFPRMYSYYRMRRVLRNKFRVQANIEAFNDQSVHLFSRYHHMNTDRAKFFLEHYVKQSWIRAICRTPLRPGMRYFLQKQNVPLAILSDFEAVEKLKKWNIMHYFSEIACSEEQGTLKPNRRVFLSLAETLGIHPRDCIFVGNNFYYDGLGAAAAGMHSICFTHRKYRTIAKNIPNLHIVTSEKELYETIEKKLRI